MGPAAPSFRGSAAADQLASLGRVVVAEALDDPDGDGLLEALVVEGELGPDGPDPQRLRVSVWSQGALPPKNAPQLRPWVAILESPVFAGSRVEQLGFRKLGCGPAGPAAVVALLDERPDEARHTLLVWGGIPSSPVQLLRFATTTGHRDPALVDLSFADHPLGLTVADLDGDGVQELLLHHDPTLLQLRSPQGEERDTLVGYRQRLFRCEGGRYGTAKESYVELLRPVASAPGAAGDGSPESGVAVRPGEKVLLPAPVRPARGLRLVSGCGGSEAAWRAKGQLLAIRISGLLEHPVEVELAAPIPAADPAILGAAVLPLNGAPWARQLLLVSPPQAAAGPVTVEILRTSGATGCLGELQLL